MTGTMLTLTVAGDLRRTPKASHYSPITRLLANPMNSRNLENPSDIMATMLRSNLQHGLRAGSPDAGVGNSCHRVAQS